MFIPTKHVLDTESPLYYVGDPKTSSSPKSPLGATRTPPDSSGLVDASSSRASERKASLVLATPSTRFNLCSQIDTRSVASSLHRLPATSVPEAWAWLDREHLQETMAVRPPNDGFPVDFPYSISGTCVSMASGRNSEHAKGV